MTTTPRRVLLVEDNHGDALLFTSIMADVSPDVAVSVVADGEAAIERLLDESLEPPDLAVVDVNLPRASGHDVLRAVRGEDRLASTPVVMLSTSTAERDVREAYEAGAAGYLSKAVGIDDAYEAIESLTTYWFETAVLLADLDAATTVTDVLAEGPRRLHVLEDDRAQQIYLEALLGELWPRAEITMSTRLAEAVEAISLATEPVDAVLSDLHLPDASGTEVVEGLRRVAPTARLVVMSSRLTDAVAAELVIAGADRLLAKDDLTSSALRHVLAQIDPSGPGGDQAKPTGRRGV
ncbi:MAG: response regulator [Actinomycetota bacterium]